MTSCARLRAAWGRTPLPLETVGGIASAVLAQHVWPLRLPAWTRPAGCMLAGGGLALVIAALRERGPGSLEDPRALVTRGLHGRSRNPIYLGCTAIQLGLAGATRNAWMLASCPVSATLLHRLVLREERWLWERFGDEYDAYQARVPRYL
jgi:protein-S-isoprenylcysteine O-methyltransferase Ste14